MNIRYKILMALFLMVLVNIPGVYVYEVMDGNAAILGVSLVEMILTYAALTYLIWILCPLFYFASLRRHGEMSSGIRVALTAFVLVFPFVDVVDFIFYLYQGRFLGNIFAPLLSDGYAALALSHIVMLLLSSLVGLFLVLVIFKMVRVFRALR
jgi:hypothetical protein